MLLVVERWNAGSGLRLTSLPSHTPNLSGFQPQLSLNTVPEGKIMKLQFPANVLTMHSDYIMGYLVQRENRHPFKSLLAVAAAGCFLQG